MIPVKKPATPPLSLTLSKTHPADPKKDPTCPRTNRTTQQRRLEVLQAGAYPKKESSNYDNRYRYQDIKAGLNAIYHHKCAYCETRERRLQVEHYRPKSRYFWLAFSWDNLLLACQACNAVKKDRFEIEGERAQCAMTADSLNFQKINNLANHYNEIERPMLLNPENEQDAALLQQFQFAQDGAILSGNTRCRYTIETCGLNEEGTVRLWRYQILEKLKKRLYRILYVAQGAAQKHRMDEAIADFVAQAYDEDVEYLAFRRYVVAHFLSDVVRDVLSGEAWEGMNG